MPRLARAASRLAALCLLGSVWHASCSAAGEPQRLFLEPKHQRTFGPQAVTPRGTIFYLRVLKKAEHNALRLYRCGVPCKTATSVKTWQPDSFQAGELLSWGTDEEGSYYFWNQDTLAGASVPATAHEFIGKKIRIYFESGAMVEAWHVLP